MVKLAVQLACSAMWLPWVDVTCDGIGAGRGALGREVRHGVGTAHRAAVGGPAISGMTFRIEVGGRCGNRQRIARDSRWPAARCKRVALAGAALLRSR